MTENYNDGNDARKPGGSQKPKGEKISTFGTPGRLGEIFGIGSGLYVGFEAGKKVGNVIAHDIAGSDKGSLPEQVVILGAEASGAVLTAWAAWHMARSDPDKAVFFGARAFAAAGGAAVTIGVVLAKLKEMEDRIDVLTQKPATPSEGSVPAIASQEGDARGASNTQISEPAAASSVSSFGVSDVDLGQQSYVVEPFGAHFESVTVSSHTYDIGSIALDYAQGTVSESLVLQDFNGPSLDT